LPFAFYLFRVHVIGVIDVRGGQAVHARAGARERYEPVRTIAALPIEPGEALALARGYLERLGVRELYVADLDAIAGHPPHDRIVSSLGALGAPLWLDAGISSTDRARVALEAGAAHVVIGLETLPSYNALRDICSAAGSGRVAFSLDLRDGAPLVAPGASMSGGASSIAARAADAGASAVIVLDLARVGTGSGLDLHLIADVRRAAPDVMLLAGGGVRGVDDLERLHDAGCDGALVATALQDGRLDAAGVAAVHELRRHGSVTRKTAD
jgi:phosphoribosylformimino-5-aminoimidazole carboxamide ribotide isomerase